MVYMYYVWYSYYFLYYYSKYIIGKHFLCHTTTTRIHCHRFLWLNQLQVGVTNLILFMRALILIVKNILR